MVYIFNSQLLHRLLERDYYGFDKLLSRENLDGPSVTVAILDKFSEVENRLNSEEFLGVDGETRIQFDLLC